MEKDWFKYWIQGIHSIYIVPPYLQEFCKEFGVDIEIIKKSKDKKAK